jgi:hypothetical protein
MPRIEKRKALVPIVLGVILMLAGPAMARFALQPSHEPTRVPIGKEAASKDYFQLGSDPLTIPLEGPGELVGYAKIHYGDGDTRERGATLALSGVPGAPATLNFTFTAPKRGSYGDGRGGMPSAGKKIAFSVPPGSHRLQLSGSVDGGGDLFVLLYYEGPPQVNVVAPKEKPAPKKSAPFRPKFKGWKLRSGAGLKFTYDDNAFKYSDPFQDEYLGGFQPEKYQNVDRVDDLIINPSLNLEGRKKLISLGESRVKLSWSSLIYWHNTKLINQEFRLTLRQYTGKGKSLEFYYSYSPAKYLRQLNDRPPLVSDNIPVVSEEFRLERNKFVATWRQKLHKKISGRVVLTQQLYYYNEPHLENDINSIEIKGTLQTKPLRNLTLDFTYAYRDAASRGIDVEGEELETSPASDGTYHQNHYQVDLSIKMPEFIAKILTSKISLRAQYQEAVFPAEGTVKIDDDPYHVGRVDNYYTYQISGSRKLPHKISSNFGYRYAERDTDSPWWGDIKEDKNWISNTIWFGMSYRLF